MVRRFFLLLDFCLRMNCDFYTELKQLRVEWFILKSIKSYLPWGRDNFMAKWLSFAKNILCWAKLTSRWLIMKWKIELATELVYTNRYLISAKWFSEIWWRNISQNLKIFFPGTLHRQLVYCWPSKLRCFFLLKTFAKGLSHWHGRRLTL